MEIWDYKSRDGFNKPMNDNEYRYAVATFLCCVLFFHERGRYWTTTVEAVEGLSSVNVTQYNTKVVMKPSHVHDND